MAAVNIVVDSALNIPADIMKSLGIIVVPVSVSIDGRTYREGADASRIELVRLIGQSERATTSQPAPGDFLDVYQTLHGDIASIHIAARSSGTHQTATMAVGMLSGGNIRVIDSASASMGGGWLAIAAALASRRGASLEDISSLVEEAKLRSAVYISVPTLKYLERGGRVTFAKAVIASLLSLKPILRFNEAGLVEVVSKARSSSGALKEMVSLLKDKYDSEPLAIAVMHADDEPGGRQLQELARQELNVGLEVLTELTASLVVHGGPGTVAIAAIPLKYVQELVGE